MSQGKGDRDRTNRRKFEEGWEYIEKQEKKNAEIERDRRRREKRGGREDIDTGR